MTVLDDFLLKLKIPDIDRQVLTATYAGLDRHGSGA